jgi:hypothetical protein
MKFTSKNVICMAIFGRELAKSKPFLAAKDVMKSWENFLGCMEAATIHMPDGSVEKLFVGWTAASNTKVQRMKTEFQSICDSAKKDIDTKQGFASEEGNEAWGHLCTSLGIKHPTAFYIAGRDPTDEEKDAKAEVEALLVTWVEVVRLWIDHVRQLAAKKAKEAAAEVDKTVRSNAAAAAASADGSGDGGNSSGGSNNSSPTGGGRSKVPKSAGLGRGDEKLTTFLTQSMQGKEEREERQAAERREAARQAQIQREHERRRDREEREQKEEREDRRTKAFWEGMTKTASPFIERGFETWAMSMLTPDER